MNVSGIFFILTICVLIVINASDQRGTKADQWAPLGGSAERGVHHVSAPCTLAGLLWCRGGILKERLWLDQWIMVMQQYPYWLLITIHSLSVKQPVWEMSKYWIPIYITCCNSKPAKKSYYVLWNYLITVSQWFLSQVWKLSVKTLCFGGGQNHLKGNNTETQSEPEILENISRCDKTWLGMHGIIRGDDLKWKCEPLSKAHW